MINPRTIIDCDVVQISRRYAILKGISEDESLVRVLNSKLYELLTDTETGLCYEMTDYIYELFLEEVGELYELQTDN